MSEKNISYSGTPNTPEQTMEDKPECRVIRLGGPAGSDESRPQGIRDLLLAVQSETVSLLEQLEQHHEKSKVL